MSLPDTNKIREAVAREEGQRDGIIGTRLENASNLLDLLPDETIAERIGLAEEEVAKLRQDSYK